MGFYTESSPHSCKPAFFYIFHLIFVSYFAYQFFIFQLIMNSFELNLLIVLNVKVQNFSGLLTYCFIIIDSVIHQKQQRDFWRIFMNFQEYNGNQKNISLRSVVFKLVEFHTLSIVYIAWLISDEIYESHLMVLNITAAVLVKICQSRIFHCMLCLDIITMNLKSIRMEAIKSSVLIGTVKESTKAIREMYQLILDMMNCINDIFGFSLLATVLYCSYYFLADLNWSYFYLSSLPTRHKISK